MDVDEFVRAERTKSQWAWYLTLTSRTVTDGVYALASSFNHDRPCHRGFDEVGAWIRKGGYNISFWVEFDDRTKWVVRFPMIGAIAPELVDEKLKTEVATMKFLGAKTSIPIPQLIGYGLTGNSYHSDGLPFLIMSHVSGKPLELMWEQLDKAGKSKIYDQLVDVSLQLRSCPFDRIGSLTLDDHDRWTLSNRPLTHSLAGLQRDGIEIQIGQSYTSAFDYFTDYFRHHRRRFLEQPNSAPTRTDAREKYAGLYLFESLITRYINWESNNGPFVLSHGDQHQANILIDESLRIVAVLDWEWSCVLPIQVACLPPICLSQRKLEELVLGIGREEYLEAVNEFLICLDQKERSLPAEQRICTTIRGMMSNGGYWFGLGIQEIYNFEYLFWDNLFPISHNISEDEAIDSVFNSPLGTLANEIVELKLLENNDYLIRLQALKVSPPQVQLTRNVLGQTWAASHL
jgi:hypothetical protein